MATSCSKPDNPRGHEPVVCFACMVTLATNSRMHLPCPMCRSAITYFRVYRAEHLRVANGTANQPSTLFRITTINHEVVLTQPTTQPGRVPNTSMHVFNQQVARREGLELEEANAFRAELQATQQQMLHNAFQTFTAHRLFNRVLMTLRIDSPACNLLVPELVQHAAVLAPNGLCNSCFFPIGYHKRSIPENQ